MEQKLCLVHANCQGEPLAAALLDSPDFRREFSPRVVLNYTRAEVPQAALDACGLFLYQHLGPEWGEIASDRLLARLPRGCASLCVPNMFFRGPWPLWSGAPGFDYRDTLLDRLIDMGLPPRDILHVYLRAPLAAKVDLDARLAETIAIERERQAKTPVPYLEHVLEHFRTRPLFYTVNHPAPELIALAAAGVLRVLGMPPRDAGFPVIPPEDYRAFHLPIHPQAAAHYGLAYGGADARYPTYGHERSFAQYAAAYVECRLAGGTDFIAWLHLAPEHGAVDNAGGGA